MIHTLSGLQCRPSISRQKSNISWILNSVSTMKVSSDNGIYLNSHITSTSESQSNQQSTLIRSSAQCLELENLIPSSSLTANNGEASSQSNKHIYSKNINISIPKKDTFNLSLLQQKDVYFKIINKYLQYLSIDPLKTNFDQTVYDKFRKHHFALKNYYDMKYQQDYIEDILKRLIDLNKRHPIPEDGPEQELSELDRPQPFTSQPLPQLQKEFESPKDLENYLSEITSKKYVQVSNKRPNLIKLILLDFLRETSLDTNSCRSTHAYNIAISYFVKNNDLLAAKTLLDRLKSEKNISPSTTTYNLLLKAIPLRLRGGKTGYRRKYYNYYLRQLLRKPIKLEEELAEQDGDKKSSKKDKKVDLATADADNSPFAIPSNFQPLKKDQIYLTNPFEFFRYILYAMVKSKQYPNAETWNLLLQCAVGPVSKSLILHTMSDHKIPLFSKGKQALISDICDFLGPHSAIQTLEQSLFTVSNAEINSIIQRLLYIPTSANILLAWKLVVKYATSSVSHVTVKPDDKTLKIFVQALSRTGRLDWVFGVIETFRQRWHILPSIMTWTHVMKTVIRTPSTFKHKNTFLSYVYTTMLKSMKTNSINGLPSESRNLIRRAQRHFDFDNLNNPTPPPSPFTPMSASKFSHFKKKIIQPLIQQLCWADVPILSIHSSDAPKTIDSLDPSVHSIENLINMYESYEVHQKYTRLADILTAKFSSPKLVADISYSFGVNDPSIRFSEQMQTTERRLGYISPEDFKDWNTFLNSCKQKYQEILEQEEMKTRAMYFKDPYAAYINDFRLHSQKK